MSACEKCWLDAGGDQERYEQLLEERAAKPCTPEQQLCARIERQLTGELPIVDDEVIP